MRGVFFGMTEDCLVEEIKKKRKLVSFIVCVCFHLSDYLTRGSMSNE